MPLYESVLIARQDISAAQVDSLTDTFSAVITDAGGAIVKKEYWGLRSLAYRIKKNRKGHYVLINLDAPPHAVQEMERLMRLNEDVLRHLTIRVNEIDPEPSVIMRSRGSRDRDDDRRRDRRDGRDRRDDRGADTGESGSKDSGRKTEEKASKARAEDDAKVGDARPGSAAVAAGDAGSAAKAKDDADKKGDE